MVDNLSKEQRSYCMSQIKRSHTRPEIILKSMLIDFEHNPKKIFRNPDFINWGKKIVVFIDGCFWHKCPIHWKAPKTNKEYWIPKLEKNIIRDRETDFAYAFAGWKVIRIWEHDLKKSPLVIDSLSL